MNSGGKLLQIVLAVAASSRRRFSIASTRPVLPGPQPAATSDGRVLMIGDASWESSASWSPPREILVADEDQHRLAASLSRLGQHSAGKLNGILLKPDNLSLDLGALTDQWNANPPVSCCDALEFLTKARQQAMKHPSIGSESCSIVHCGVLNECEDDSQRMSVIREVYRVLSRGGVARFEVDLIDEPCDDAQSGLLIEGPFINALIQSDFYGARIVHRSKWPTRVNDGSEFYAYVVDAFRGKEGPCLDRRQSVIYRGPWKKVFDDDGHAFERGARIGVCDKTFSIVTSPPYADEVIPVEPHIPTPPEQAPVFDCRVSIRPPLETKALQSDHLFESGKSSCCS